MKNPISISLFILSAILVLSSCSLNDDHVTPDNGPQDQIFQVVEEMPSFPGCEGLDRSERAECSLELLDEWIDSNLIYPQDALDRRKEGTAIMTFVVDKNGAITLVKLLKDPGNGMGEEALRLIEHMRVCRIIWSPGKQRGTPVRVQFNVPIRFEL